MEETLNADQLIFLRELADIQRKRCDFILADMFRRHDLLTASHSVSIWVDGKHVLAKTVVDKVLEKVRNSMIFEQWEYDCYLDMRATAERLTEIDSRVLMVAAGFGDADGSALYYASREAVTEAQNLLYGG